MRWPPCALRVIRSGIRLLGRQCCLRHQVCMVHTATTPCYLVIAGPPSAGYVGRGPRRVSLPGAPEGARLVMQYTAASPTAKYMIACGQPVPADHPITAAWAQAGTVVRAQVPLPFARGRGWAVPCEALAFRRRVFAVFHVG